jgi:hypothetical protein
MREARSPAPLAPFAIDETQLCASRVSALRDHGTQLMINPFEVLNGEGVQKLAELRYQSW